MPLCRPSWAKIVAVLSEPGRKVGLDFDRICERLTGDDGVGMGWACATLLEALEQAPELPPRMGHPPLRRPLLPKTGLRPVEAF